MKLSSLFLICLFLFVAHVTAQKVDRAVAIKEAVETERAFARTSELKGTRDSFLAFIADDGILFRPTAVNGKKWLLDHPTPPSPTRSWLNWQPSFGDVAGSGDMAYTTGPWQFRRDIRDEKPIAFGHFVTVWKKQADGKWKFAIDLGISHPQIAPIPKGWQPAVSEPDKQAKPASAAKQPHKLLIADIDFSSASQADGSQKAFNSFAANEIRVYRNEKLPMVGRQNAVLGLPARDSTWTWTPAFAGVSNANDLGYTYGSYEVRDVKQKITEKGNYLRIWKNNGDAWKVVLDLADPLPLEEKKN